MTQPNDPQPPTWNELIARVQVEADQPPGMTSVNGPIQRLRDALGDNWPQRWHDNQWASGNGAHRESSTRHFSELARCRIRRRISGLATEAALDGIYVLRTSIDADTLDASGVVHAYKNLSSVERDFRSIKADDLDLRPIHHHVEDRVRARALLCMLAFYLVWHLRQAWAPITFTDEHPPERDNPVAPAHRSPEAQASHQRDEFGDRYRTFGGLLHPPGHSHPQAGPLPVRDPPGPTVPAPTSATRYPAPTTTP